MAAACVIPLESVSDSAGVSPALDAGLFRRFQDLAYRHAGIYLKEGKDALVAARISKRLRALGMATPREYLALLERDTSGEELIQFLDVISTNYTSFYREPGHFDLLERQVRGWVTAGARRLRIWCAAASTGEEPYSIAFTVERAVAGYDVDYRILATDISMRALQVGLAGVYSERSVSPIDPGEVRRCFHHPAGTRLYRVADRIRQRVVFRRLNLAEPPFVLRGPLDFIFCRNVMIYFDRRVRERLAQEIWRLLRPEGLAVTGHAESLSGMQTRLRMIEPSVYTR